MPKLAKTKKSASEDNNDLVLVSDIMKQLNESCSSSGEASKCETSNASAQNVLLEVEVENLRKELEDRKSNE